MVAQVAQSIATGALHVDVDDFLKPIRHMQLSEEKVESAHAKMQKHRQHAPSSLTACKAASTRLSETLPFYGTLDCKAKEQFATEWQRVKRIVQVDPLSQERGKLVTWVRLCKTVYEQDTQAYTGPRVESGLPDDRAPKTTPSILCRVEYFRTLLQERCYYTLGDTREGLTAFQLVWLVPPQKMLMRAANTPA